jgi:hypothetical protein
MAAEYMASLTEDVKFMSKESQEAFAALLPLLSKLYRDDAQTKCVMLFATEDSQTLIRINADEFEAHGIIHNAVVFHDELLTADQPRNGRLN